MAKYSSKIIFSVEDNKSYDIVDCEEGVTEKSGFEILRVTLASREKGNTKTYGMTLWPKSDDSEVLATSGFGSMLVALGSDTSLWIGKSIFIRKWSPRFCEVQLMDVRKK